MQVDPPILSYAAPTRRTSSLLGRLAARFAVLVLVAIGLLAAAVALPHPQGIWYFGRYPKLMVAIDSAGLTVGREDKGPQTSGWVLLMAVKLIAYSLPVWLVWRFGLRSRRSGPVD